MTWPLPVVSSTSRTLPGPNTRFSPSETSTSTVPSIWTMKSRRGALCGSVSEASDITSRKTSPSTASGAATASTVPVGDSRRSRGRCTSSKCVSPSASV